MRLFTFSTAIGLVLALGCAAPEGDTGGGFLGLGDDNGDNGDVDDDNGNDADGDGLSDDDEDDLGTDPNESDSDGDGVGDGEEVDQNTDPLDEDSKPFEGGWPISSCNGELKGEGYSEGDVSEDWTMQDQFGEDVNLHAFCDNVIYMVFAAFW
jgi:hypothetical protein